MKIVILDPQHTIQGSVNYRLAELIEQKIKQQGNVDNLSFPDDLDLEDCKKDIAEADILLIHAGGFFNYRKDKIIEGVKEIFRIQKNNNKERKNIFMSDSPVFPSVAKQKWDELSGIDDTVKDCCFAQIMTNFYVEVLKYNQGSIGAEIQQNYSGKISRSKACRLIDDYTGPFIEMLNLFTANITAHIQCSKKDKPYVWDINAEDLKSLQRLADAAHLFSTKIREISNKINDFNYLEISDDVQKLEDSLWNKGAVHSLLGSLRDEKGIEKFNDWVTTQAANFPSALVNWEDILQTLNNIKTTIIGPSDVS
jgi:hypothetical protein